MNKDMEEFIEKLIIENNQLKEKNETLIVENCDRLVEVKEVREMMEVGYIERFEVKEVIKKCDYKEGFDIEQFKKELGLE